MEHEMNKDAVNLPGVSAVELSVLNITQGILSKLIDRIENDEFLLRLVIPDYIAIVHLANLVRVYRVAIENETHKCSLNAVTIYGLLEKYLPYSSQTEVDTYVSLLKGLIKASENPKNFIEKPQEEMDRIMNELLKKHGCN